MKYILILSILEQENHTPEGNFEMIRLDFPILYYIK